MNKTWTSNPGNWTFSKHPSGVLTFEDCGVERKYECINLYDEFYEVVDITTSSRVSLGIVCPITGAYDLAENDFIAHLSSRKPSSNGNIFMI